MKRTIALVLLIAMLTAVPAMASASKAKQVVSVAMEHLGAPYELKSDAPKSFNCFSFVAYCVNKVVPGRITTKSIEGDYKKIKSIKSLKAGDIICFKRSSKQKGILGYHYGIYVGKGYFIHAANKHDGVTISKLGNYKRRFVGAVRVF